MTDPFVEMDKAVAGHRDSPLNPAHVGDVYTACLPESGDGEVVFVEGIAHNVQFDGPQLDAHRKEIAGMLAWLPTEFLAKEAGGGGGWSFLNACNDRDGKQWTGLHLVMEQLVLLGLATDQVAWCLPRKMWDVLPGQMPYFVVTLA